MNISNFYNKNINAYTPYKYSYKPTPFKSRSNLFPLQSDVFCKFNKIEDVEKPKYSKEDIEKLYEDVLLTVKKENPMFQELNIPTPEVRIVKDEEFAACYSILSNIIEINESQINEDTYILIAKDNEGNRLPVGIFPKSALEINKKYTTNVYSNICGFETIKTTDSEKELYLKSCIAHELRHCLQEHLCLSLEGSEDCLKFLQDKANKYLTSLKEILDLYKENKNLKNQDDYKKYLKEFEEAKKEYSYILNFKPNKVLDENTTLKFSTYPKDKRKWSVKNHFIKALYNYDNTNREKYCSSPDEIDAYNYQKEYILKQSESNENKYRKDAISAAFMFLDSHVDSPEELKNNGYDDLK